MSTPARLQSLIALLLIAAGLLIAGVLRSQEPEPVPEHVAPSASTQPAPVLSKMATTTAAAAETPIGWVDVPIEQGIVGTSIYVAGWALDRQGIRNVEVRLDGRPYQATYGVRRDDVAKLKPGYPDSSAAGFEFTGNFPALEPARHQIAIVAINRAGAETVLARKDLLPHPAELGEWRAVSSDVSAGVNDPFYIVPGLSGVGLGAAQELDRVYAPYLSPTIKVGMRVPLLYLRTTKGAASDWIFDPDWDVERRCGNRRIADDALSTVLDYAVKHQLPVLFTLNGGIWADAACDVPAWDVNDHLEQDVGNCQWNEHDQVMPDDYLKNLAGATEAPELGRSLTFNVYAVANRHYKKRNLQAAARMIADFARKHPRLFVGVNLDPDTYVNPFYAGQQWYDYNPGTLKQFRQWLAGTGPYAGKPARGVPDLSAYRRARPLTIAEVGALAGRRFDHWSDVDPPRVFPRSSQSGAKPFWDDPWTHEWEVFRRHLVKLHYDELSQWTADAGIAPERIFSSQGFVAPVEPAAPFAIRLESPSKNYDTGGMSVEGAIPRRGHLGAILYGPSAVDRVRMEHGVDMFATFQRMDPGWGVVEFNTADFRSADKLPTYQMGYQALRDMFNHGARFASPMAWNGSNGINASLPGYVSFMAWRNTPLEDAARDFALSHAWIPRGARLWTFGSLSLADADGWTASGALLRAGNGYIDVAAAAGEVTLLSPDALVMHRNEAALLVLGTELGTERDSIDRVAVEAEGQNSRWIPLGQPHRTAALTATAAGVAIPLRWPPTLSQTNRIRLRLWVRASSESSGRGLLRIRHIAVFPPRRAPGKAVAAR